LSTDTNPQNICYAAPGLYDVTLIAANGGLHDTLVLSNYITIYPLPQPFTIQQSGDTLFAPAGFATYQWYYGTTPINQATNYFYIATANGDYNVLITDTNGCGLGAGIVNVAIGISETEAIYSALVLFPNPAGNELLIYSSEAFTENKVLVTIFNMLGAEAGQTNLHKTPREKTISIPVKNLSPGIYFLRLTVGERNYTARFIKQ